MSRQSHVNSEGATDSPSLVVIADDLTGACDAAVAFTGVAQAVRVQIDGKLQGTSGVTAISTNTRDISSEEAERSLAELSAQLPDGSRVFKKIDSVFRGNSFVEIAAVVRCFPADLVLVAPAYPELGRRLRNGILHIQDSGTEKQVSVVQGLRDHGCQAALIPHSSDQGACRQQLQFALEAGSEVLLCDAWEQAEMVALAAAAESLPGSKLWIGSGGLAHALASQWRVPTARSEQELPSGSTVFFIGSDHPVTRGQQVHLQRMTGIRPCSESGAGGGDQLLNVPRTSSAEDIQRATTHLDPHEIGCLFMTGGDTALLVCSALGIKSLRLQNEFAPGVPLGVAEGGRFDGVSVILKSGGFGDRNLLCRILDSFARKERVHA